MTKNTYNAKHIELGKKFLANKFVNADWDNDDGRLTISINVEDRIWTDGSSIWSKGVVKGVKVGGIVLNAHKMEDNYWDGGLLGNVDYDGSGKDGTWYDGVDDESALINRNTSAESDGLIYTDRGFDNNLLAHLKNKCDFDKELEQYLSWDYSEQGMQAEETVNLDVDMDGDFWLACMGEYKHVGNNVYELSA